VGSREARQLVVDALDRANAIGIRSHPERAAFLEGKGDIAFNQLEMDSLARMELCIALEVRTGIEVMPEQLDEIGSLARLADMLEK
jgi:hypothetical protein